MLRLFPGLVRIPDVAFASWDCFPEGRLPDDPIPELAPDLVVEVLSRSNTPREMRRKLREYFAAGVRLAWMVDLEQRTVTVHTGVDACVVFDEQAASTARTCCPDSCCRCGTCFPNWTGSVRARPPARPSV